MLLAVLVIAEVERMLAARVQEELDLREVRQHHARVGSKHARELTPAAGTYLLTCLRKRCCASRCAPTRRSLRNPFVKRKTARSRDGRTTGCRVHAPDPSATLERQAEEHCRLACDEPSLASAKDAARVSNGCAVFAQWLTWHAASWTRRRGKMHTLIPWRI